MDIKSSSEFMKYPIFEFKYLIKSLGIKEILDKPIAIKEIT